MPPPGDPRRSLSDTIIFRFYVQLWGCNPCNAWEKKERKTHATWCHHCRQSSRTNDDSTFLFTSDHLTCGSDFERWQQGEIRNNFSIFGEGVKTSNTLDCEFTIQDVLVVTGQIAIRSCYRSVGILAHLVRMAMEPKYYAAFRRWLDPPIIVLQYDWMPRGYKNTSWWLNQPIWKICSSNWIISPGFGGENKTCLKPPTSWNICSIASTNP